ncbi:hypothetical protein PHJA_001906300 [Phtheirospermum japonicum]|uniref:Uncharacterized protein n=1 Tax=Phtheirospermum japonicum TaxID=374723 RepID=A0A830CH81_9LAMI|nr:hypothetical protein PHJA_001906300 [Phtheirospermum japonicum]
MAATAVPAGDRPTEGKKKDHLQTQIRFLGWDSGSGLDKGFLSNDGRGSVAVSTATHACCGAGSHTNGGAATRFQGNCGLFLLGS